MKPAIVLVSLGALLALAGGFLRLMGSRPPKIAGNAARADASVVRDEVRHPVTAAMLFDASSLTDKPGPFRMATDIHGKDLQIGGAGKRPQFIYFILDGCPCSLDAQPLFNRLYRRFQGKVDFIGIINVGKARAIDYSGANTVLHPIVADEKLDLMRAFHARQSTYNLIVRPDGAIEKMWPGYSQATLAEVNSRLAQLTNTKAEAFDASLAPKKMDSGCYFY